MCKELSGLLQAGRSGDQGRVITGDVSEVHEKVCRWLRKKGVKDPKPVHYLRKFTFVTFARLTGHAMDFFSHKPIRPVMQVECIFVYP
jgi:hypothetical protein